MGSDNEKVIIKKCIHILFQTHSEAEMHPSPPGTMLQGDHDDMDHFVRHPLVELTVVEEKKIYIN